MDCHDDPIHYIYTHVYRGKEIIELSKEHPVITAMINMYCSTRYRNWEKVLTDAVITLTKQNRKLIDSEIKRQQLTVEPKMVFTTQWEENG